MLHTSFDVFANKASNFNCERNIERFDQHPASRDARIEAYRETRGCGGLPSKQSYNFPPFILKTCPCTFQNRSRFTHLWTLFDQYERHGNLPFEGPLSAQPSQILEAFDVLRTLKSKYEDKQRSR